MAKIFRRKIDYYLATWTCLVAIVSMIMIVGYDYPEAFTFTCLGIGVAFATTTYGVYMSYEGYDFIKNR
jgi:4-hydroxybenzoate polyprenyltransferase